jgi:hypothetical protein
VLIWLHSAFDLPAKAKGLLKLNSAANKNGLNKKCFIELLPTSAPSALILFVNKAHHSSEFVS